VTSEALSQLSTRLTAGALAREGDLLEECSHDASYAAPVVPLAVVEARSREDVVETMRWATEHGVPVTARGAGTGKSGGCIAQQGGLVLSLARMNRIVSVEPRHGWAEVEPGVITGHFRDVVADEHGLFYPPDPASLDWCTLGGNVATNAGGPVALKYGVTGSYVMGVEAVLADGRVLETGRRQPKSVAGYDLTSLLVGSEGTLGVITKIRFGLRAQPQEVVTALLPFASVADAAPAVPYARAAGVEPRAMELFCGTSLARASRDPDYPGDPSWGALVLAEFDGGLGEGKAALKRFLDGLPVAPLEVRCAESLEERAALWAFRRRTSKLVKVGARGWRSDDVAVPLGEIPTLLAFLPELAERHDLTVCAYGHAGDGNMHVNLLWEDEGGEHRLERAAADLVDRTLALGGTISGEHGIGSLKRDSLVQELGSLQLQLQRSIRRQWDPQGILNPGKVL